MATNIKDIQTYNNSLYVLFENGALLVCGKNNSGELGLGHYDNVNVLTQIPNRYDIKEIYCGNDNLIVLTINNSLWGCGKNNSGELGLGHYDNVNVLTQIPNSNNIKKILFGATISNELYVVKNDNTLWGCGYSDFSNGKKVNSLTFMQNGNDIKDIYKLYHCEKDDDFNTSLCVVKNDNTLWIRGYNRNFAYGLGHDNNIQELTQIPIDNVKSAIEYSGSLYVIKNDGTLWGCGDNSKGQLGLGKDNNIINLLTQIPNGVNIKDIYINTSGNDIAVHILKNDGTLWGCGKNNKGQLGINKIEPYTYELSTTSYYIGSIDQIYKYPTLEKLYVTKFGTLLGCGDNSKGQLGFEVWSWETEHIEENLTTISERMAE